MDPRLQSEDEPPVPAEDSPQPHGIILWRGTGSAGVGVGDQDGKAYDQDGDHVDDGAGAPDLEKYRLILPPLIRIGYALLPPMLTKSPGARVSTRDSTRLANDMVDCAYQDEDLMGALEALPDDCKIGIALNAWEIYMRSEKVKRNEGNNQVEGDRERGSAGSNGDPLGLHLGSGGRNEGAAGATFQGAQYDPKSADARFWGAPGTGW